MPLRVGFLTEERRDIVHLAVASVVKNAAVFDAALAPRQRSKPHREPNVLWKGALRGRASKN